MHAKASFVFWLTLSLYFITLFTVSYVGVYLTYIAIPIIVVSGVIMKFSTPKAEHQKLIEGGRSAVKEVGKATGDTLEQLNGFLGDINRTLENYNKINKLVEERAATYNQNAKELELKRIPLEVDLKYSEKNSDKLILRNKIKVIDDEIEKNERAIKQIRQACELEVKSKC